MESKTMPAIKKYIVAANNEDADLKAEAMREMVVSFAGMNPIEAATEMGKIKKFANEIENAENKEEILEEWQKEFENNKNISE